MREEILVFINGRLEFVYNPEFDVWYSMSEGDEGRTESDQL
nr:hypothetical protein [Alicyclobacillus tolerans]